MALVRIMVGVLWLTNVNWKMPPTFGEGGGGLYGFTKEAVDNPVFAPFSWLVERVILPNFIPFGWSVLLLESLLGACLLLGLATRFWAVVGTIQSLAITMSVALTPGEWPWSYYMMVALNLVLAATAAGRTWGLDALARPAWRARRGRLSRLLLKLS
ncbi:MAG: TQO small subunit DoxD [Actinobacteria bacterium]|nr:TQO small subunit DoxD [Actinomycetota bacterium]